MDKAIRRQIKKFEKSTGEAARLKEKAARLLKRAGEIESAQKPAFEAIILKAAYDCGLDRLPLQNILAAFATLQRASPAEVNTENTGAETQRRLDAPER